jgi:hypothetical protein
MKEKNCTRFIQGLTTGFFVGLIFTIFLISHYENRPIYENIEEIITIDSSEILTFPNDAEIYCEDGAEVREYFDHKTIYGCMNLVPSDGFKSLHCSGHNKLCYVKYDKLVQK